MFRVQHIFRNWAGWLLGTALVACSWGCGNAPLALKILNERGLAQKTFLAAITLDNGRTQRLTCPGPGVPPANCTGTGLQLNDPPDTVFITIKARDYQFITKDLQVAELPSTDGLRVLTVTLKPLPPLQQNSDYCTGFEPATGLQAFQGMAFQVDTELGPAQLVKFYIHDLQTSPKVYFQNTRKHPVHYAFVRNVLGKPLSLTEFEQQTYHGQHRPAMAGTLVYYRSVQAHSAALDQIAKAPIALTFFPSDDLTPAQAALAHRLLEERLAFAPLSGGLRRLMYLPAGTTQEAQLQSNLSLLAQEDVAWVLRRELFGKIKLQILNTGLAYGTLKRMSPEQLQKAVVSYGDILVLTRLPNSLPVVGGTITEELQTPLAHVNVAARARGTPNIALLTAAQDPKVKTLLGKLVRFEVKDGAFSLQETTLAQAQAFWKSQQKKPLKPVYDLTRKGLPSFGQLSFSDAVSVGSKAANLAELSQLLGAKAPRGFAIPFYYYDRFMQLHAVSVSLCEDAKKDCLDEGRSAAVCEKARAFCADSASQPQKLLKDHLYRLLNHGQIKVDSQLREAALDGLRYQIRHLPVEAAFAKELNNRVAEIFGSAKVRLRSSTNAEDLANFSGAGLYLSVSAHASGSKKASEEVRKVWASTWNWSAFEERSFWNVDHWAVRMGVAVNQAFSDEAANGVLITQNIADPMTVGMYVNVQQGETPVTNPESGALPEIFSIVPAPAGIQVARLRYSSLSPSSPILSAQETQDLYLSAYKVQQHFAPLYKEDPSTLHLDLEFKLHGPARALYIKQARPYIKD